ncbi:MAG TPA: OmpA family protein [Candidatus Faecaligallichristensenella faecipullorum]|nr:OmpA family protein [Candidatus Faecaligallichristensenella faecipullorum]
MRYTGRRRGRASREVGNNNHWISFSDLMSALLLVIVLIMFYSIYQYVDMLELATADLLEQQGLLEAKEQELRENQDKLTESEELQVTQAAKLLLQQQQLEEAQALLAQQREELSQIQTQVSEQQIQLDESKRQLDALVGVRTQIIASLSSALREANVTASVDPVSGAITMDSGVFFDLASSELKQSGKDFLDQFMPVYLEVLLSDENIQYVSEVIVEGHTDTTGTYMSNLALSQERARAVAEYILSDSYTGISSETKEKLRGIIAANGRSYSDPILNEDGSVNMEASRRVEFKFRLKDEEMIEQMRSMLEQLGTTPTVEPTAQATAEAQATPAPEAAATPETVQPTPEAAATPEAAQATPEPAPEATPAPAA